MTPAGLEAWANYEPERSPIVTCELMNIPTLFYADYPLDIGITEEEVVIHHELYDVIRRVPLDSEPRSQHETGLFGVANARFEGDVLVIESSDYPPSPWGLAVVSLANGNGADVPSSAQKRLTERYSVIEGGKKLRLDFTLEDPVYLTEPFSDYWEWRRLAEDAPVLYEFECDPDSAAQFTGLRFERDAR